MVVMTIFSYPAEKVEFMGIHYVSENNLIGIELFFTSFFCIFKVHLLLVGSFSLVVLLRPCHIRKSKGKLAENRYQ